MKNGQLHAHLNTRLMQCHLCTVLPFETDLPKPRRQFELQCVSVITSRLIQIDSLVLEKNCIIIMEIKPRLLQLCLLLHSESLIWPVTCVEKSKGFISLLHRNYYSLVQSWYTTITFPQASSNKPLYKKIKSLPYTRLLWCKDLAT